MESTYQKENELGDSKGPKMRISNAVSIRSRSLHYTKTPILFEMVGKFNYNRFFNIIQFPHSPLHRILKFSREYSLRYAITPHF